MAITYILRDTDTNENCTIEHSIEQIREGLGSFATTEDARKFANLFSARYSNDTVFDTDEEFEAAHAEIMGKL
jgi:hypothetical protein